MKRWLLATTSVVALATVANAADMPVKAPVAPPSLSWTGFYIGVQGGLASHWGRFNEGLPLTPFFANGEAKQSGGTFGGHVGFNIQQGNIVFGLESDLSWVGAKANATWNEGINIGAFDVPWIGTVRGRLGVTMSPTLLYVTGGVAFGRVEDSVTATFLPGGPVVGIISQSKTRTGWTFGGGVEHRLASNWTVRLEGRYVDLGRSGTICATPGAATCTAYTGEFRKSVVQGLAGVSLKF